MKLVLKNRNYKAEKVTLASGFVVSAENIHEEGGVITEVTGGVIHNPRKVETEIEMVENNVTFSVYRRGEEYITNINQSPASIDARAIIIEFLEFCQSEIQ